MKQHIGDADDGAQQVMLLDIPRQPPAKSKVPKYKYDELIHATLADLRLKGDEPSYSGLVEAVGQATPGVRRSIIDASVESYCRRREPDILAKFQKVISVAKRVAHFFAAATFALIATAAFGSDKFRSASLAIMHVELFAFEYIFFILVYSLILSVFKPSLGKWFNYRLDVSKASTSKWIGQWTQLHGPVTIAISVIMVIGVILGLSLVGLSLLFVMYAPVSWFIVFWMKYALINGAHLAPLLQASLDYAGVVGVVLLGRYDAFGKTADMVYRLIFVCDVVFVVWLTHLLTSTGKAHAMINLVYVSLAALIAQMLWSLYSKRKEAATKQHLLLRNHGEASDSAAEKDKVLRGQGDA
jgi:hypothetical protein